MRDLAAGKFGGFQKGKSYWRSTAAHLRARVHVVFNAWIWFPKLSGGGQVENKGFDFKHLVHENVNTRGKPLSEAHEAAGDRIRKQGEGLCRYRSQRVPGRRMSTRARRLSVRRNQALRLQRSPALPCACKHTLGEIPSKKTKKKSSTRGVCEHIPEFFNILLPK